MAVAAISTAGMKVLYASGATRPTSGYTEIPGVTALPALGDNVNTLQTTPLSATKNHTYIPGLADPGGAIQLTVNDAPAFRAAYSTFYSKYLSAVSSGHSMWLQYQYPAAYSMSAFFVPVEVAPLGFGGAEVDSVLTNQLNVIPAGDYEFAAASTT